MKRWKAEKLAIKKGVKLTRKDWIGKSHIFFCHDDHDWYFIDKEGNESKYFPYLTVINGWKIYKEPKEKQR